MFQSIDILKSALGAFFKYNFYIEAIIQLREALKNNDYYKDNWNSVIELVINRGLKAGEALSLLDNDANLPLHENSDEEAYRWLALMIINSLNVNKDVIEYNELILF
jgi:hypothetical protein